MHDIISDIIDWDQANKAYLAGEGQWCVPRDLGRSGSMAPPYQFSVLACQRSSTRTGRPIRPRRPIAARMRLVKVAGQVDVVEAPCGQVRD
jgi:hypothetical protein